MNVHLKFLGACQTVTGSKYLLRIDGWQVLVDCGLFQGLKAHRLLNWEDFPIPPAEIDAVILTHAHIDHSGYLPRLVKQGFRGSIYCTEPTAELLRILLLDSAKIQEEEAERARRGNYSRHNPPLPLYTQQDAQAVFSLLCSFPYQQAIDILPRVRVVFQDAGHILGSAIAEVFLQGEYQQKKIVFSGDLGRYNTTILYDPTPITEADILLIESTYGDRDNPSIAPEAALSRLIHEAIQRGGCLLIPAFALGRTQTLLYYLRKMMEERLIPSLPVYIDSPMAIGVTALYKRFPEYVKVDDVESLALENLFHYPYFHYVADHTASFELSRLKKNAIIISASGMMTGGRILDHLHTRLSNPQDTVLIAGFQAEGTRGRKLLDGASHIRIYGEDIAVKCHIAHIEGLSAHADRSELLQWLSHFEHHPKRTFVVHGEREASEALAQTIRDTHNWQVIVPNYLESFSLLEEI